MRGCVVVALSVLGASVALAAAVLPRSSNAPVVVTVDAAHPGRTVPRSFIGYSIEYQSVPVYMGSPAVPNRTFTALTRGLAIAQGAPVAMRIGGNSGDQSWWNPAELPRPRGVTYDLGPAWVESLATGQRSLRGPVALAVNLALNEPANAVALAQAVEAAGLTGPGLTSLEIGNEPQLYSRGRTFRVGRIVVVRPRQRLTYSPAQYVRDASRYVDVLRRRLGPEPALGAGGFATDAWARSALSGLLAAEPGRIEELLPHAYALAACNPRTDPGELRARLLTDDASRGIVRYLAPYLGRGLPVRVSEFNSAICGGAEGVSDTFAAALWAPDALFALAHAGVRQVDVHTWAGAFYAPFDFTGHTATVRPMYYGLLLFARAAPAGSRLLPVRLADAGDDVRAWATKGADGTARVLLLNRSRSDGHEVRVRVGDRDSRTAHLQLLRSPGLDARDGVTLAGESIASSGELPGRPVSAAVSMRDGEGRLTLPPASGALLVVP